MSKILDRNYLNCAKKIGEGGTVNVVQLIFEL